MFDVTSQKIMFESINIRGAPQYTREQAASMFCVLLY